MTNDDDWTNDPMSARGDDAALDERLVEMRKREAEQMPSWFLPLLGGAIIWVAAGLWLQHKINWPYSYGFPHACGVYGVRGCWAVDLIHSPALLEHPTGYSLALFGWFMSMAAALIWILVHAARRTPLAKYLLTLAVLAACFGYLATDPAFQRATWNS